MCCTSQIAYLINPVKEFPRNTNSRLHWSEWWKVLKKKLHFHYSESEDAHIKIRQHATLMFVSVVELLASFPYD